MTPFASARRHLATRLLPRLGRAGAVAIITAVAAPILVMIVGFVVDFAYASYINQCLARATDAATIGSVSQTAGTAGGGYGDIAFMQSLGVKYFNANISSLNLTGVNFSLTVASDGNGGVTAAGSYSYNVPTFFAGVLGFSRIPVAGSARTAGKPLVYVNYYILVDNSQSMGIGATQSDMTALYQRVLTAKNASTTDGGCVFGCHVPSRVNNQPGGMQLLTNEELAHNPIYGTPITLRIDSAVSAINSIVSSAAQIAATSKNVKIGLYTLEVDPTTGKRVQLIKDPPSSDYAAVQLAASTIDLGNTVGSRNTGDTDFANEFTDFLKALSPSMTQGSGASATSPLNYIFLITDGLTDVVGACLPYNVCTSPIDASSCTTLKANATVGVIYTTYLPIYQFNTAPTLETRYAALVDGKPPGIRSALQNCATSSDFYFEAQDGPTLISSMQTLFQRTQSISARLSQ